MREMLAVGLAPPMAPPPQMRPRVGLWLSAAADDVCIPTATDDPNVCRLEAGSYFNKALGAANVWEIDVDTEIIDEAAEIFFDGAPFKGCTEMAEPYEDIRTKSGGRFFAQRTLEMQRNLECTASLRRAHRPRARVCVSCVCIQVSHGTAILPGSQQMTAPHWRLSRTSSAVCGCLSASRASYRTTRLRGCTVPST